MSYFTVAQNHLDFIFDLKFETGVYTEINGESMGQTHKYKLEKFESSCKFGELEYQFQPKDTLLIRYFKDFEGLFERPGFYRNFNKNCPDLWSDQVQMDGILTSFRFKSDSVNIGFGATDGICNFNSLYDSILDNFFNIVFYVIQQPAAKGKMSELKLSVLNYDEGATGSFPIRLIRTNPLTYRLKSRVFNNSNSEVISLLNKLPKDKNTYIEVGGSFYVMKFDSFYSPFKEFLKAPNKIIWIPNDNKIAADLKTLGVDKKHMKKSGEKSK